MLSFSIDLPREFLYVFDAHLNALVVLHLENIRAFFLVCVLFYCKPIIAYLFSGTAGRHLHLKSRLFKHGEMDELTFFPARFRWVIHERFVRSDVHGLCSSEMAHDARIFHMTGSELFAHMPIILGARRQNGAMKTSRA